MTQIKDLVTVAYDNAFLMFPVDEERYELIVALYRYGGNLPALKEAVDTRIYEWIAATLGNFQRCCDAVHSVNANRSLNLDRARRVQHSLPFVDVGSISSDGLHTMLCSFLWAKLHSSLSYADRKRLEESP
jgi:hypothetical protein